MTFEQEVEQEVIFWLSSLKTSAQVRLHLLN